MTAALAEQRLSCNKDTIKIDGLQQLHLPGWGCSFFSRNCSICRFSTFRIGHPSRLFSILRQNIDISPSLPYHCVVETASV